MTTLAYAVVLAFIAILFLGLRTRTPTGNTARRMRDYEPYQATSRPESDKWYQPATDAAPDVNPFYHSHAPEPLKVMTDQQFESFATLKTPRYVPAEMPRQISGPRVKQLTQQGGSWKNSDIIITVEAK